uniref:Putative secreted protein n=1 Tax=Ixodes ricinus TaxID=34613 RepID=A0A6B0UQG9_IXORI
MCRRRLEHCSVCPIALLLHFCVWPDSVDSYGTLPDSSDDLSSVTRCLGLTLGSGSLRVCSRPRYLGTVFRRHSAFEQGMCRSVLCRVCLNSVPGFEDLFILFVFFFCKQIVVRLHCIMQKHRLHATNF